MSSIPSKIKMTKDGGRYYRMMMVFYCSVAIMLVPLLLLLLVAIMNPLWFRDDMLEWTQVTVESYTRWRTRLLYRIYLGTDPEFWHALKD